MNFNLTITLTASDELLAAINNLAGGQLKPGKVADMKVSKPAAAEKSATEKTEKAASAGDDATAIKNDLDLEAIANLVREKISEKKTKAVKSLLEEFKVVRASELQPVQYEDFMTKLKAV